MDAPFHSHEAIIPREIFMQVQEELIRRRIGSVPSDLVGAFSLIFYSTPQEAVFKTLGVE